MAVGRGRTRPALSRALIAIIAALIATISLPATASAQGAGSLELVAQSAWIDDGGVFDVQVRVAGASPDSTVVVEVFPPLTDRTELFSPQATAGDPLLTIGPLELTTLQDNSNEVLSLQIAVAGPNTQAADSIDIVDPSDEPIPVLKTNGTSGVYPINVRLVSADGELADEFTSHLIELPRGRVSDTFQVVMILPIDVPLSIDPSGQTAVDAEDVAQIIPIVDALETHAQSLIAVDLEPQTLATMLQSDDPMVVETATRLTANLRPDEVFAQPYIALDQQAWIDASLGDELAAFHDATDELFISLIGQPPDRSVILADPKLSNRGVEWLLDRGVSGLLVGSAQLEPPTNPSISTPVNSSFLIPIAPEADKTVPALEIDPSLSNYFIDETAPSLAANNLLTDLTMRALEQPGTARASIVRAPDGWEANPTFLNVLLSGIERIPVITSATPKRALETTEFMPATGAGTISAPLRRVLRPETAGSLGAYRTDFNQAEAAIASWQTVVTPSDSDDNELTRLLRASTNPQLSEADRQGYIDSIYRVIDEQKDTALEAQPSETITLTSRETEVPIVVINQLTETVSVVMLLDSEKLTFPEGNEVQWVLSPGENRLDVPIEALASGDSPIRIQFMSPDRQVLLGSSELLVRTIAFSGVGIVIGAVALGVLLLWWLRQRRSSRATLRAAEAG